jgi:hypothetical protein
VPQQDRRLEERDAVCGERVRDADRDRARSHDDVVRAGREELDLLDGERRPDLAEDRGPGVHGLSV